MRTRTASTTVAAACLGLVACATAPSDDVADDAPAATDAPSDTVPDTDTDGGTGTDTDVDTDADTDADIPAPLVRGLLCRDGPGLYGLQILDVGTFEPGNPDTLSNGFGLNEAGQVTGTADGEGDVRAFLWNGVPGEDIEAIRDTELPDLATIRGQDVNSAGAVAGHGAVVFVGSTGFYWHPATGMTALGSSGHTVANGLNDAGVVAGFDAGPVLWDGPTGRILAAPFADDPSLYGEFFDVNNALVAVGEAHRLGTLAQPMLWSEALGTVMLPGAGGNFGEARAINEGGFVVARSLDGQGRSRCLLYNPADYGAAPTDLGLLGSRPDVDSCRVEGINDHGEVVGSDFFTSPVPSYRAWVWKDGTKHDLTDLLTPAQQSEWQLDFAVDINDRGMIVGTGTLRSIPGRAFVLRPVCSPRP